MSAKAIQSQALSFLTSLEKAGKTVSRVTIEGRRIEVELVKVDSPDEFEKIDMRHDQT